MSTKDGVTDEDLLDALIAFQHSFELVPRHAEVPKYLHVCAYACMQYNYHDLYICCVTGNFHHCTAGSCDRAIPEKDSAVCEITGLSHPLDFVVGGNYDNCDVAEKQRVNPLPSPSPSPTIDYPERSPSPPPPLASSVPPVGAKRGVKRKRKCKAADPTLSYNTDAGIEHTAQGLNIIRAIFRDVPPSEVKKQNVTYEQLVGEICQRWTQIANTEKFKRSPTKYKFVYHVLVMTEHMISGYYERNHCVVKEREFVRLFRPKIKQLASAKSGIKPKIIQSTFTKSVKYFAQYMAEKENITFNRTMAFHGE